MFDFSQNDIIKKEWELKSRLGTYFSTSKQAYLEMKKGTIHFADTFITLKDIISYLNRNESEAYLSDPRVS